MEKWAIDHSSKVIELDLNNCFFRGFFMPLNDVPLLKMNGVHVFNITHKSLPNTVCSFWQHKKLGHVTTHTKRL